MKRIELIITCLMKIPFLSLIIAFSLFGICIGIFLIINPALAIEIQKQFYEKINWRIQPVSMAKELRNTRIMGWLLIILLIAILTIAFVNRAILL